MPLDADPSLDAEIVLQQPLAGKMLLNKQILI